eukprot:COSAG05_NODE_5897_length_1064_cov_1.187565_2_plen_80_part_00
MGRPIMAQQNKAMLPSALTFGKTRQYVQLAMGRLQWLVETGKARVAHTAILKEIARSGMARLWGITDATLLPPTIHSIV